MKKLSIYIILFFFCLKNEFDSDSGVSIISTEAKRITVYKDTTLFLSLTDSFPSPFFPLYIMSQHSLSSSSSSINTESSSSTILNDGASTCSNNYTLHQVLSNPKLLCAFECFLRQTWSHENLLFIEAMTQLKHEESPKAVEASLHRIYKNFLAKGSPLELNVTTQDKVRQDIQALQWAIVDRVDAVTILQETEAQVLDMLVKYEDIFVYLFLILTCFHRNRNWQSLSKQWKYQSGK